MFKRRFIPGTPEYDLNIFMFRQIGKTHGQRKRKNDELRRIHERQMAGIADFFDISDPTVYVVIGGHDGPEDYQRLGWTYEWIERKFGLEVRNDIEALTNPPKGEITNAAYNLLLQEQWRAGGHRVVLVKSIDRIHGLLKPWPGSRARMIKKMQETERYLIPLMVDFKINTYVIHCAITILQRKYGLHPF